MNNATDIQPTPLDPDGCCFAALMLIFIEHGPWHELELPDVLDALVLLSRGHSPAAVAEAISQASGRARGYGYIRSVRKRAANTLNSAQPESWAA